MSSNNRKLRTATARLLDDAEAGLIRWEEIARGALNYMSEDQVRDMGENEGLLEEQTEEENDDDQE